MSRVERLLEEMEQHPGSFMGAWIELFQGPMECGDRATTLTYRVLPRVVDAAEKQDPASLEGFWHHVAVIVANFNYPGMHCEPEAVPAELDAPFRAALVKAEVLALRAFAAKEWDEAASDLALACLALSHHPAGCLVWQGPCPPRRDEIASDFARFNCFKCGGDDLWFMHVGDGVAPLLDWDNPPQVPDTQQPEPEVPPQPDLSHCQRANHPWSAIAVALDKPAGEVRTLVNGTPFPNDFLDRCGAHLVVAAAVARAGVPKEAPNRAVLSLLGVMVALSGAFDWAGRLLRLAGHVRCPDCGQVDLWENCMVNIG